MVEPPITTDHVVGMLRNHSYRAGYLEGTLRQVRRNTAAVLAELRGRKNCAGARERLTEALADIDNVVARLRQADELGPWQPEGEGALRNASDLIEWRRGISDHG